VQTDAIVKAELDLRFAPKLASGDITLANIDAETLLAHMNHVRHAKANRIM
jgi:hypothetical protein